MQIRSFLFFCLAMIFIFTPFQKGLYFDNIYWLEMVISFLFLIVFLYLVLKQEIFLSLEPSLFLILPLVLALSLFKAETPLGGIQQLLRWTSYSCFFYLMYFLSSDQKYRNLLMYLVSGTGFIITMYSVAGYTGMVDFQDIKVAGRLAGVLQYPNSFAVLMAMLLLFSLVMLSKADLTKWDLIFYGLPVIPYVLGIALTESRAVMLIFPFVWLLGLIMLPFKQQLYYFLSSLFGLLACLLILKVNGYLMVILFVMSLIFLGFTYLLHKLFEKTILLQRIETFRFHILIIPFVNIVVIAVAALMYPKRFFIGDKIHTLSLNTDTLKERLIIANDAIRASFDSLLLGFGGKGWSVIYTKYQSLPYQTKNLHNGLLEWLLNAGFLGLIFFVFIIGYYFVKLIGRKKSRDLTDIAIFLSLLLVFIHSFMDFNLSFGTIWLFILTLIAMGLPRKEMEKRLTVHFSKISFGILAVMAMIMLVFAYRFNASDRLFAQVKSEKSIENKLMLLDKSIQYNQYDFNKWAVLGLLLSEVPNQEIKVKQIVNKMLQLEPNNSTALLYSINILKKSGLLEDANKIADKAIQTDQYNPSLRQESIQIKTSLALSEVKNKDKRLGYTDSALNAYRSFSEDVKTLKQKVPNENFNSRHFAISEETEFYAALSAYIKKDYKTAVRLAEKNVDSRNEKLAIRSVALVNVIHIILKQQPNQSMLYNRFNHKKVYRNYVDELKKI